MVINVGAALRVDLLIELLEGIVVVRGCPRAAKNLAHDLLLVLVSDRSFERILGLSSAPSWLPRASLGGHAAARLAGTRAALELID